MNRRDTIIIAVLLNATILTILFVTAVNEDGPSSSLKIEETMVQKEPIDHDKNIQQEIFIAINDKPKDISAGDEIDNALKQFTDNPHMILVEDETIESLEKDPAVVPPSVSITPPQNPQPPKSTIHPNYVEVTVKKGDALEKIARANATTVEAIKKANDLKTSKLNIGQVLKVPVGTKKSTVDIKKEETKVVTNSQEEYYTIKSGDNPWKVARQYNVKFDDLLKLNGLDEEKARNLKIGDKIRVK